MRKLNHMPQGTALPRLNMDEMEKMFHRDALKLLGVEATQPDRYPPALIPARVDKLVHPLHPFPSRFSAGT